MNPPVRTVQLRCTTETGAGVAGTAFLPPRPRAAVVCFPGGRFTRDYWDLQVSPEAPDDYSFARFAAARGVGVVTIDHLGTGHSSRPDPEPTAEQVRDANAAATAAFLEQTGLRGLPTTGVGHSMGAALLLHQQSTYRSFDRLAVLGYPSGPLTMWRPDGTRWRLTATNAAQQQRDVHYTNLGPDLPAPVRAAVRAAATVVPGPVAEWVSRPGVVAAAAATVEVPVLLGFGDRDVTADPALEPRAYPRAAELRLVVIDGSFHCHNLAPTRRRLWAAVTRWAAADEVESTTR